jgi:hypothetical protein
MIQNNETVPFWRRAWWTPERRVCALAAFMAILARLAFGARSPGNYDIESYKVVVRLIETGQSVYANTARYNYGPLWSWLLWCLWKLAGLFTSANAFHFCVSALLTLVDMALAFILARRYTPQAALFFLTCPISILITGVHGQFDNLAVLVGLCAWLLIEPDEPERPLGRLMVGAALLGLSISIKHILVFFPLWILLCPRFGSWPRRVMFVGVAWLVFALGFAPWLADPASRNGIVEHVLLYRSKENLGIMSQFASLLMTLGRVVSWKPIVHSLPMACWCLALMVIGWWTGQQRPRELFFAYLVAMVGLSPAMADQYLAIPLVACALAYRYWPVWLYSAVATVYLLCSRDNLALFHLPFILFLPAQLCLLLLLLMWSRVSTGQEEALYARDGEVQPESASPVLVET